MYARVTINFFGYNRAGKRGIGCGLGNVMKTREGEPLAGGASAQADFAGIGNAPTGPAAYGAPVPAPAPVAAPAAMPGPVGPGYGTDQYGAAPAAPAASWPQPGAINPLTGQPYYG